MAVMINQIMGNSFAAPGAGIVPAAGEALVATPILGLVLGASLVPAIAIAVAGGII